MLIKAENKWYSWNSGFVHVEKPLDAHILPFDEVVTSKLKLKKVDAPFWGTKILCVGKNYRKHAEEMDSDVPKRPLWFMKPISALIGNDDCVEIPMGVGRVDYEGELALVIGKKGKNIPQEKAAEYIFGVTAAFDITARDLQKSDGQWTRAKGFDTFCPIGPYILPYSEEWKEATLKTFKNDELVQNDKTSSMVFGFEELISDISNCMTLEEGDLILTGTPAGIGEIESGDRLKLVLEANGKLELTVSCKNRT
jgi:2-keto-4-pentenoate hydratase/2-oxohepta-3-ene-1,7-dioic acid hydratase in catechol pathway